MDSLEKRYLVCFVLEIFNLKCPCDSQMNVPRQLVLGWGSEKRLRLKMNIWKSISVGKIGEISEVDEVPIEKRE